jgi:thioredoxin-related protein
MEEVIFPKPEVHELLKKFVRVRLYTDDRETEELKQQSQKNRELLQSRYNSAALPFYAMLSSDGKDIANFPAMTRDPKQFARFLRKGL